MATQYIPTEQGFNWFNRVSLAVDRGEHRVSGDELADLTVFEIIELEQPSTFTEIMKNRTAHPEKVYCLYKEEVVRRSLRRLFEFGYIDQVDDNDENF